MALEVQIFGVHQSADTRKALRFFSERQIKTHFVSAAASATGTMPAAMHGRARGGGMEGMDIEPVTLAGRHVRLEPLSLAHLDALCAVGLDEELWRWTTAGVRTRDDMQRYIETALEWREAGTALPFATMLQPDGTVIGSSRFANIDRPNRRLEIGWTWIGRPWQRTPANTEAKYLMLRHAFEVLGCIRVEFKTDVLNTTSRNALLRIGARE